MTFNQPIRVQISADPLDKMTYIHEVYKGEIKSSEEYFATWDQEQVRNISQNDLDTIYQKHICKHIVFNRDNFKCQNTLCQTPDSPLTLHRVTWGKNGGEYIPKNGLTLCNSCHKAYNRCKRDVITANRQELPKHMRNKTFHRDKPAPKITNKEFLAQKKALRREIKFRIRAMYPDNKNLYSITWKRIIALFTWLFEKDPYDFGDD